MLLKDYYNENFVANLADQIAAYCPSFDQGGFVSDTVRGIQGKEYTARMEVFADAFLSGHAGDLFPNAGTGIGLLCCHVRPWGPAGSGGESTLKPQGGASGARRPFCPDPGQPAV